MKERTRQGGSCSNPQLRRAPPKSRPGEPLPRSRTTPDSGAGLGVVPMHNCARLGNPSKALRSVTLLGLPSLNPSKLLRSAGSLQAHAHACSCVAGGSDRVNSRACCSRRLTLHGRANAPWNTLQARSRSAHLHLSRERFRGEAQEPENTDEVLPAVLR